MIHKCPDLELPQKAFILINYILLNLDSNSLGIEAPLKYVQSDSMSGTIPE